MKKLMNPLAITLALFLACTNAVAQATNDATHYSVGSLIEPDVTVYDVDGRAVSLVALLKAQAKSMNVVFIFGGGGLGHERTQATGGLWCPDSFEDSHIIRSLKAAYGDGIGIFPIAVPPAHHSRQMGFAADAFLDGDFESNEYKEALVAFVDSTQAAFKSGTIPVQPFYDSRFNLMASDKDIARRGARESWSGAFRAADETQTYGVPSIWLVGADGRILHEPFRGNDYHGHGDSIKVIYTLSDVVDALERQGKAK